MGRIQDQQRHVQQVSDLHLATIEALALAIDAKDQTAQSHIRRVQVYAAGLARALGMPRDRDPGRQDRGAAARHRQAGGARAHPVEARAADAGGVPEDPHSPAGRRRDHQRRAVPLSGGAAHPEPPRAVGRQGLSGRPARARRSRSARASCRSSTTSTRSMSERPYHKADEPRGRDRPAAAGKRQGARSARRRRRSSSCIRRSRPKRTPARSRRAS